MTIAGENDGVSAPSRHLVFAYYVTGHGFGHATRVVEVVRHLILAGHDVYVVTGAPDFVFTSEIQSPRLFIRKVLLDCGSVQTDALTVDRLASLEKVSDVVPVACLAAADAGIRSVCVTNFSWDFIYAQYVMAAGNQHRSTVWQIAEDYSHCEFLIRLPGYCPMPAFRDVVDVPLVVRRLHKSRKEVRKELGISDDVKLVILNFGGQPSGWKLKEHYLPSGWLCLVCGASNSQKLPPNFIKLAKDAYTPDLIAASDCMLGKIGYGTVSEALAYKLPFIFVRRDYFNEEPFLRNMLEYYHSGVEMIRRDLLTGHWEPYLERAINLKPCYEGGINGGEVAAWILQETAIGKAYTSNKFSGARRLRDAIVLGYQLQRVAGRDISIPEWYTNAKNELSETTGSLTAQINENGSLMRTCTEDFEILHGDFQGLSDTMSFVKSLVGLDNVHDLEKNTEKCQRREHKAAAALFNWEEDIFVARAPGRLDVMGGIADYSGSLVLQMPIKEACHVAIQRNHPTKHRLWKHAQARQTAKGNGPTPVLQIVSYGSELSNRSPTFDMDLSDFMDGGKPISYSKAKEYFSQDPSQKWAAYVAGTILVLMTELGVCFEDSISMLVSSAVPEGKGVSSSASVEVASMSAIASAHGLSISPRDIALLCQKVENHIVGAPCGIMDQMTSACGEANKLLAMLCQPAEVIGLVEIPNHIRFWGIDSGIRHSVGGADYGSVRIGAFMGRQMIKSTASTIFSRSLCTVNGSTLDDLDDDGVELLKAEASLDYLCNLSPHRFEAVYAEMLPEAILGETFFEKYNDHNDPVTVIDQKQKYWVKAPTKHPIYENFRVKAFKALLTSTSSDEQLTALGELMYQRGSSFVPAKTPFKDTSFFSMPPSPSFFPPSVAYFRQTKPKNGYPRIFVSAMPPENQKKLNLDSLINSSSHKEEVLVATKGSLCNCLSETNLHLTVPGLKSKTRGKVRDTYDAGKYLVLVTTDRQSAFDRILASIPFKGQVLNETSLWWFERTQHITANAVISAPDKNVTIAKKCSVFPVEFVVRGYVTGSTDTSLWTVYKNGVRYYCGNALPDGMVKNQKLPANILTPTTKSADHDAPVSPDEIIEQGLMTQADFEEASWKALKLFEYGQKVALEHGLILVDTKYEFGKGSDGSVLLLDEVHTPDSSRYWIANSYEDRFKNGLEPENVDKEFLRLWFKDHCNPYEDKILPDAPEELVCELAWRYIFLYETITKSRFEIPLTEEPIHDRISRNVEQALSLLK